MESLIHSTVAHISPSHVKPSTLMHTFLPGVQSSDVMNIHFREDPLHLVIYPGLSDTMPQASDTAINIHTETAGLLWSL